MHSSQPEFAPFFEALKEGRLRFPRCPSCGQFHWYPMKRCPHCRSTDIEWSAVKGRGSVYSWTLVRYPFDPDWTDDLPYVVALVEFEDAPGVRLVTNIVGADPGDLSIGIAVDAVFPGPDENPPVVRFRPAVMAAAAS